MLQQSHIPLTNGIMSFLEASEDHDLAPIGIGSMHEQAQKLAEFGRHGDIYFVHAAEGETVVPLEVLNANPKVKDMLFNQMREMGLDPEEFVVGNELNSINPVTGMPEFFFSKIWRGVKKVASKAWKGIKAAAPYVIPLVFAAFGVPFLSGLSPALFGSGSFGAAFLGSGIGTLAGGGSMKDALKAGAMAGVMNFGLSGARSAFTGGDFMQGAMKSVYNPQAADFGTQWGRFTGALDPAGAAGSFDAFMGGQAPGAAPTVAPPVQPPDISAVQPPDISAFADMSYGPGAAAPTPSVPGGAGHYMATRGGGPPIGTNLAARTPLPSVAQGPGFTQTAAWRGDPNVDVNLGVIDAAERARMGVTAPPTTAWRGAPPGSDYINTDFSGAYKAMGDPGSSTDWLGKAGEYYDTAKDYMFRGGDSAADVLARQTKAAEDAVAALSPGTSKAVRDAVALKAMEGAGTTMLEAWGPTLALGTAGYAGYEATRPDPKKEEEERKAEEERERQARLREWHKTTGEYKFAQTQKGGPDDPEYWKYRVRAMDPYGRPDDWAPPWQGTRPYSWSAAEGGLAGYPPRDLLVEGAGTERSDDIPAMLSDGEFVMNAKAVRGADPSGGGNRYAGANNLYNMMRNFEMRS
jgi:hypothetical protein